MSVLPVIFVSHGPPLLATAEMPVTACWSDMGRRMDCPRAVICISAHFEATVPLITGTDRPETIHDFSGPPGLFTLAYPCPGAPQFADRIRRRLASAGLAPRLDRHRGLDHGAWVPLRHMFPDADIPVVQVAIQTENDARHHFELGRALKDLRDDGVLILASGGAVHDLDEIVRYRLASPPPAYAGDFDDWLNDAVTRGDSDALIDFQTRGPDAQRCHPWPAEHFLPLLVAQGAAGAGTAGCRLHRGFIYGVLSMAAFAWD